MTAWRMAALATMLAALGLTERAAGRARALETSEMERIYHFDGVSNPVFSRWLDRAATENPAHPEMGFHVLIPRGELDALPESRWGWGPYPSFPGAEAIHLGALLPGEEGQLFVARFQPGQSGTTLFITSLDPLSRDEIASWRGAGVTSVGIRVTLDIEVQRLSTNSPKAGSASAEVYWDGSSHGERRIQSFFSTDLAYGAEGRNQSTLSGTVVVPLADVEGSLHFFQAVHGDLVNFKRLRIEVTAQR